MVNIRLLDSKVLAQSSKPISIVLGFISFVTIFVEIPDDLKLWVLLGAVLFIGLIHIGSWIRLKKLTHIKVKVDNTQVTVKVGDIFAQDGLKVIAFNEYFDTTVDDVLIARNTLNGRFLTEKLDIRISDLDKRIAKYPFHEDDVLEVNEQRRVGKKVRYKLGTIYPHGDEYLLAAFSRFNDRNKAVLTMPEYLAFMINFWDNLNNIYAGRNVSTTIMGSGITLITKHRGISAHELLKIMLWTYRVSETRVARPAILSVIVGNDLAKEINFAEIEAATHGL